MGRAVAVNQRARSNNARVIELVSDISSVPRARHLVAEDLRTTSLPPSIVENALIVVTELVTNAILHAQPLALTEGDGIVLRWKVVGDDVLIDVSDGGGPQPPRLRQPSSTDGSGRGLAIVDALTRHWSFRAEPGRVTVDAVVGPWEPTV